MRVATFIVAAVTVIGSCFAQQKGSIRGSVSSVTGEPLRNAIVIAGVWDDPVAGSTAPQPRSASAATDAQGNFVFEGLDPAKYGVCANHPGYLYHCWVPKAPDTGIAVAAGQSVTGIDIKMTPQAVISGKVTDEFGDPYPLAQVKLARPGFADGHKSLQQMGSFSVTNAEGAFTIAAPQAGKYFVMVVPHSASGPQGIPLGDQPSLVTTYYPGTTEVPAAIALDVADGAAVRGIDIRLRSARTFRIRGRAQGFTPGASLSLRLTASDPTSSKSATISDQGGEFEFDALLPGRYLLTASQFPSGKGARQIVTISNEDLHDVVLMLTPGADVTGAVSFTGPKPQQPLMVGLGPVSGPNANVAPGQMAADGSFAVHHLPPAKYRVELSSAAVYIKSAKFDGRDVTGRAIDLTSGSGGTLDIVLAPNTASISGVARDSGGKPLPNVAVTLWKPDVPGDDTVDFSRSVSSDASGQFKFSGIAPGEYRVAAWEERLDSELLTAPQFRSGFDSQAGIVKLSENQQVQLAAPVIGRAAIDTAVAKLP